MFISRQIEYYLVWGSTNSAADTAKVGKNSETAKDSDENSEIYALIP